MEESWNEYSKKSGRQEWEVTDISTKTDGRDSEHPNLSVDHYGNGAASQHGYTMCERVLNHVGDEKIHDHFAVAGGVKPWGYWEKVDKGSTEDEMPACQLSYSIVNGGKFIAPDEM
ncbi:uncharacterized protein I206_100822 [Kwoniella pini CBS 10737]|uniref:Uncharacterized protein n=1 Tax=Kwoniella pini CBS 10737 TaxID=1296096 RepID=A0A1B9ICS5_9TREE|nr:uncharacterized protein I206_00505 [Kwoniella pini CBS 10737]OCF53204.1 hypothetical protein I206_00505 [Kwoniella pini CBS 10737]